MPVTGEGWIHYFIISSQPSLIAAQKGCYKNIHSEDL